ncbi:MAG: peptidoglycan bridge formation glycyltransferase FemA/FemB family protein [Rhizobiaceae bacterium]|nr:peptidoglycan bridge formation glycyltransferase FemA/FemB family protein [Rhizobiaceae bacterium]
MNTKSMSYKLPFSNPVVSSGCGNCSSQATCKNSAVSLEIISSRQWDEMAELFDDMIVEQTGVFNNAHWEADNIECVRIIRGGDVIGGAALIVRKIPFTSTGLAVLKWGPVWHLRSSKPREENYDAIISALIAEYCERRNFHLTIMPMVIPIAVDKTCDALSSIGFKAGNMLAAPEKYFVNTGQKPEELMASLNQKWRYNLRKANKNEFDIRFVEGKEGLDLFLKLYSSMIERKQFLDASAIGSLRQIMQCESDDIRPKIVIARHKGEVTAGGVFFVHGKMASYMFGATDERALTLKAGYAMHWWVAEYLCDHQHVNWYDLGGNDLDAGLHQFKKGFVGKTGIILKAPPRYHYATSLQARAAGGLVFWLRDARAAAIRMFYKVKQRVFR